MRLYEYIYKGTVMFIIYMPLNNTFLSVRRSVSFRDFEITKRVDRKYKVRVFSVSQCSNRIVGVASCLRACTFVDLHDTCACYVFCTNKIKQRAKNTKSTPISKDRITFG